jgi:L-amino acid N-acyltransferase YncA
VTAREITGLRAGSSLRIRSAAVVDAGACAEIYAPYVLSTCISLELEPLSPQDFAARIVAARSTHEWLVVERGGGVVGYASGHVFNGRAAYDWSCETEIFLATGLRREGVGHALYEVLLDRLARRGYRRAIACVALPNEAGIEFHHAFGFEDAGCYRRVGWKNDAWHDVAWLQRDLQGMELDPPTPVSPLGPTSWSRPRLAK